MSTSHFASTGHLLSAAAAAAAKSLQSCSGLPLPSPIAF